MCCNTLAWRRGVAIFFSADMKSVVYCRSNAWRGTVPTSATRRPSWR
jgi:hypothetical protein